MEDKYSKRFDEIMSTLNSEIDSSSVNARDAFDKLSFLVGELRGAIYAKNIIIKKLNDRFRDLDD